MAETLQGHARAVTPKVLGSELTAAASSSATSLQVADAYPFGDSGTVSINGVVYAFMAADPETDTITLATGLTASAAIGDRVDLWDADNGRASVVYEALVLLDGQDGGDPFPAEIDERDAGYLAQAIRAGAGESVTLVRDGARYRVQNVRGKTASLESMLQLGAGGLTTRTDPNGPGTELNATGFALYDDDGNQIVRIGAPRDGVDVLDEGGFFVYQLISGRLVVQLNTGTSRDQPSIQADPAGTGADLMLFSGASTLGRESWLKLLQGEIILSIEDTPDSGTAGSQLHLTRTDVDAVTEGGARVLANADTLLTQSEYHSIGGTTMASVVYGNDGSHTTGYRTSDGTHIEGMLVLPGGNVEIRATDDVLFVTANGGAWRSITCQDVNSQGSVSSVGDIVSQGNVTIQPLAGGGTTSASIDNSGHVIRTPSSRRYKSNIQPLAAGDAAKVLDLEPVTFTLRSEAKDANRRRYPGFIAEQAADAGLDFWVDRNKDGEPEGLRYSELTAALVSVAKGQRDQIDTLTQQLADLTQQVADLRGQVKTNKKGA